MTAGRMDTDLTDTDRTSTGRMDPDGMASSGGDPGPAATLDTPSSSTSTPPAETPPLPASAPEATPQALPQRAPPLLEAEPATPIPEIPRTNRRRAPPIEIVDRAPREETHGLGGPSSLTIIPLADSPGLPLSVGDALSREPGLEVRSLGGPGSYSTLQVRGASAGQLAVFLDGIPLNPAGGGEVNLEELPQEGILYAEVYRGSSPLAFAADAVGGVLNLVSSRVRAPLEAALRVSAGAFGYARLAGSLGGSRGPLSARLSLGARTSRGDFPYLFNQLYYDAGDDQILRRANNDGKSLEAAVRLGLALPQGESLQAQVSAFSRQQGIAPRSFAPAFVGAPRLQVDGGSLWLRGTSRPGRLQVEALGDVSLRQETLEDPAGDVSLSGAPELTQSLSLSVGISVRGTFLASARQAVETVLVARDEGYAPDNAASARRRRLGLGAQYLFRWRGVTVQPGVLFDQLWSLASPETEDSHQALLSPRLGLEWLLRPAVSLKANVGQYHRVPTFFELYGNQGVVVGNPKLLPETGRNADLSLRGSREGKTLSVGLEATGFLSDVQDVVLLVQNSQQTVRPENAAAARLGGLELAAWLDWPRLQPYLHLGLGYTYLQAIDHSGIPSREGKQLPGRPRHSLNGSLEGGPAWLRGHLRLSAQSGCYLDPANLQENPSRVLGDVGLTFHPPWPAWRGLEASLEVRNLGNVIAQTGRDGVWLPVMDFVGFPLPGRAAYLGLSWRR